MIKHQSITPRMMIALGLLYLIWGSTFLSVRILLEYLPPLVITFSRNFTAGFLLLVWSVLDGHWKRMSAKHWRVHLQAGILLISLGNGFMSLAGSIVPSGFSSVFMALGPSLLVLFFWLDGRRPSSRKAIATIIGLLGIVALASQKTLAIHGKEQDFLLGIVYLSLAVIAWNIGVFRTQVTGANTYHFTQVCAIQMLFGAFIVSIFSYAHGDFHAVNIMELPWNAWAVFFYLALIGSMLGFSLFGYLSKACDATLVATYTYVNPVIALILGNLILNEPLSIGLLLASFLILFAVVLITTEKPQTN